MESMIAGESTSLLVDLQEFESWILEENDDILVLNKPGWLVCHPSKNGPLSSLVGAAKTYLGVGSLHLASRLDRETSGVVLLAKHRKAASHWQKAIEQKSVKRRYLAILRGEFQNVKRVSNFLGNDSDSAVFVKQKVLEQKTKKAKKAETTFEPLLTRSGHTFCRVRTFSGRKHQIRVHAQWIGHELIGDKLYGPNEKIYLEFCEKGWKDEWLVIMGMKRQALHGEWLGFEKGDKSNFSASLAGDMMEYLNSVTGIEECEVLKQINKKKPHSKSDQDNLVV